MRRWGPFPFTGRKWILQHLQSRNEYVAENDNAAAFWQEKTTTDKKKHEKSFHLERLDCMNFCRESVPLKQFLVVLEELDLPWVFLRCLGSIRDVIERGRGFALSGLLWRQDRILLCKRHWRSISRGVRTNGWIKKNNKRKQKKHHGQEKAKRSIRLVRIRFVH